MGNPTDLSYLRELFKDQRRHIAVGKITKLGVASDRSCLRVSVLVFDPTAEGDQEHIAIMGWDDVGPDCGSIRFPEVDDLVLVAFADGEADDCYVVKRLTSKDEQIPLKAVDGHSVYQALAGKKAYLASDTAVLIGKPDSEPDEPLVLGNVNKEFMEHLLDALLNAPYIGLDVFSLPVFLAPDLRTLLVQYKATYLTNASTNILSQIGFTERGED